jgi:hypothetical protein
MRTEMLKEVMPGLNSLFGTDYAGNPSEVTIKEDMVNHPPHYTVGGIEVIDFIEAKNAAKHTPVFANTGVRAETVAKTLKIADGVIAGSGMKFDGKTFNPVDPARVVEMVKAADKSR